MAEHKTKKLSQLKMAVVVFASYPADVRVRREAQTMADAGISVDVICDRKPEQKSQENIDDVRVYRINMQRQRHGKFQYLWQYLLFTFRAFLKLTHLYWRNRYKVIHIHNMPDILVFCALVPRLSGAKILLDLHDPMPEIFMAKYFMTNSSLIVRILRILERLSIRFAHHVATPNLAFRKLFISRGCPPQKIDIIMNVPMEQLFFRNFDNGKSQPTEKNGKFVVMFHGTIVERYGLQLALQALSRIKKDIPNLTFNVFGVGDYVDQFLRKVKEMGLEDIVNYNGYATNEQLAKEITAADVGLIPNCLNSFTQINLPVRIFEYLALDKPTIVPKTPGILDYFSPDSINYFKPDDINSLAQSIVKVYREPDTQRQIIARGKKIYMHHHWNLQRKKFLEILENLTGTNFENNGTKNDPLNKHQPYAIVIGLDSIQGLQTARILAQNKVPVLAIAKDSSHFSCFTNSCEKIFYADTSSEEFIHILEKLGPTLQNKAVLFPCEDNNVLLVSRYREILQEWYRVILPEHDLVEMLMSKIGFFNYSKTRKYPIPKTFILYNEKDTLDAGNNLHFPCIVKPPIKSPKWENQTNLKAFKVLNPKELSEIYQNYSKIINPLIVQEWIEGPDTNHYTCNCYFNDKSRAVISFTTQKLRQYPPHTGQGTLGQACKNSVVLQETLRFFSDMDFKGLAYLDMKRDSRNGKYYMVEPNIGRPTGRSATAEACGTALLYTMYCDAVGLPLPIQKKMKYRNLKWIQLRRDLQASFYYWKLGGLSVKDWWRSIRGPKTFALFSMKDPLPFFGDLMRGLRLLFIKEERKKRDHKNPLN